MDSIQIFSYGYSLEVAMPFEEAVRKTLAVFQAQGFGVLTEIDVQAKMKEKIGKEMEQYVILGMCNPALAASALDAERNIGLLLPCNVIVREAEGKVVIGAQRPSLFSTLVDHPEIKQVAEEAEEKILAALRLIAESPSTISPRR